MPKELFGTDGIRGIPGEYPLDDRTLYWVGRSLGGYLRRAGERGDAARADRHGHARVGSAHRGGRSPPDWPTKALPLLPRA